MSGAEMRQLQALLVDDEVNLLRNLEGVLPWEELGIRIAGTAKNGVKALELAEAAVPDLVLCDIRMPVMDGLTFLRELRERGHECGVIMLTGFQEFEYARSALKYGAKDFILKPIDYEELQAVVARLAAEIRRKLRQEEEDSAIRRSMEALVRERVLLEALTDGAGAPELLPDAGGTGEERHILLVADLDGCAELSRAWSEEERRQRNQAVRQVLREALTRESGSPAGQAVLQMRDGEWVVLIGGGPVEPGDGDGMGGEPEERLLERGRRLRQAVQAACGLTVSIAAYPEAVTLARLRPAYLAVQRLLYLPEAAGDVAVLHPQEAEGGVGPDPGLWRLADAIVSGTKAGDRRRTEEAVDELARRLSAFPENGPQRAERVLHFLLLHLMRELRETGLLEEEQEAGAWRLLERGVGARTLLDTVRRLTGSCMEAGLARHSGGERLMLRAKEYIRSRLAEDFGLEEAAQHLGISCSYFSLLFKQHLGETFLEHVTRERIGKAKRLLAETDKSVTQIGKLVGYPDRRYFTRVFHKLERCSPSEYREQAGRHQGPASSG
ncbi:response regulator transcription factor [Gorillibacterium sp. sgz5001074]|uniref:response regulator transcription factor n=1 Tax=Gorillibacterium sp. sgz5001074 TaxID=3446695 RepID=UPI003F668EE7